MTKNLISSGKNAYSMTKSDQGDPKKKKRRWLKYTINSLLVLVMLTLFIPSWRSAFQTWFAGITLSNVDFEQSIEVPMPDEQKNWELVSMKGELINFAEFEGKPIVIQFWATWCTYCKAQFPDLGKLRDNFNNEVVFIAVTEEPLAQIQASGYADKYDFLYCTQLFPSFFSIKVYPTLVIMDKEMNLVYSMEGAGDINNEVNVAFLKGLL